MAIKKADALKGASREISDVKPCSLNGLPLVQISLTSGEVGYMSKDRYTAEMPTWPVDKDDNLQMPADMRLSNKGYWTSFARPTGLAQVTFPGE